MMEEGLYNRDIEIFDASDVDSDEDSMDDQVEEVVYDEEDFHQGIQFPSGGYDYVFVDEVSPNHKCGVCLHPMRDAVQTSVCGHRFCRDCLIGTLRSDTPVCPIDRQEIEEEGGFFTDKAWAREILSLRVKCKQSKRGCDWIDEVRYAEEHQRDCPYEDTECGGCDENIQRRHLQMHLAEECPKRVVECVFCGDEFYFIQKQKHEQIYCQRFPLVCENNCRKEKIPRGEMAEHISEKCLETIVSCPYSSAGCPFQDKRGYLNEHNEATLVDHLEMVWAAFASKNEDLRQKFDELEKDNQRIKKKFDESQNENEEMKKKIDDSEKENERMKKKIDEAEKENERMKLFMEGFRLHFDHLALEVQYLKDKNRKTAEVRSEFKASTILCPQRLEVHSQLNYEKSPRRIIPRTPRRMPESNAAHSVTSNSL